MRISDWSSYVCSSYLPNQVNLRVRIAGFSREITRQFGFNWDIFVDGGFQFGLQSLPPVAGINSIFGSGDIGDASIDALIDALAEDDLITILAEPNLTAVTGETARFLAGGEFPIPVSQDEDTITVIFKTFGVRSDEHTSELTSPLRTSYTVFSFNNTT